MEQQTQPRIKPNVLINNQLYYDFDAAVKLTGRSRSCCICGAVGMPSLMGLVGDNVYKCAKCLGI